MPYEKFDRSKLKLLPLSERISDVDISIMADINAPGDGFYHPSLAKLAEAVREAKRKKAAVIMMCGAHVIRQGVAPYIINLMREGFITQFSTNGAGAIHDFEFAMAGKTCESVAKYISEGQFGLWAETGKINDALVSGAAEGIGAGEAIGKYIVLNDFPHAETSVLAQAYKMKIPATVHIGVGSDITHEHPNFDGAAAGAASYTDFLIYARTAQNLEGGVFMNFGSAVAGPEVYLKCLAMARNAARGEGKKITDFTTAVFDLLELPDGGFETTPEKTEAALVACIPKGRLSASHHYLIHHGRRVCHARRPECGICVVSAVCLYHSKVL